MKVALFGLLIVGLVTMWTNRTWVSDAYRQRPDAEPLRLTGVDLAFTSASLEPSPYSVPTAPDARHDPRPVAFGTPADRAEPPSPDLFGGEARLSGIVNGPDGPVAGATIQVERHGDDGSVVVNLVADEDGRWELESVKGGRYRVRAWVPNLMTMGRSEVRFLADDSDAVFEFSLWGVDPTPKFEFVADDVLYQGVPGTVAVVLGWRSIDESGLIVTHPLFGASVAVETTPGVELLTGQPHFTDPDGAVRLTVRCLAATSPTPEGSAPPGATAPDTSAPAVSARSAGVLTAVGAGTTGRFALPGCHPPPEPEPGFPLDGPGEPVPGPEGLNG